MPSCGAVLTESDLFRRFIRCVCGHQGGVRGPGKNAALTAPQRTTGSMNAPSGTIRAPARLGWRE